ncbi:MAG: HepT-like ribonuclease domain-containing protein [Vulcanimicrobiota bacterium]
MGLPALEYPRLAATARQHALEFVAVFGSSTNATCRPPADFDLAVMPLPGHSLDRIELFRDLSDQLERSDIDLVCLPGADWPVCAQIARTGAPLYEHRPGAFRDFVLASYWRTVDSGIWRRRKREYLKRFLERRLRMERDLMVERLLRMSQYLAELELVLEQEESAFHTNPLLHRTAERDIELLVECAARINTEIGESKGIPPSDYYSSFFALKGLLGDAKLRRLADSARLRDLLVHQYEKVDLKEVYATVRETLPLWRDYIDKIQEFLDTP